MHTRVIIPNKQNNNITLHKKNSSKQSNNNISLQHHGAHNNKTSPTTSLQVSHANAIFTQKKNTDTQHKPKAAKKKKKTSLQDFVQNSNHSKIPFESEHVPEAMTSNNIEPKQQDSSQCSICHDTLSDVTASTNCNHTFCFACISEWTTNYLSTCPLCKAKVTSLTKHDSKDGSKDEQQIPYVSNLLSFDPNELSQREVYACLDHGYFLQEISGLTTMADRIQAQLRPTVNAYRSYYKIATPQKNMNERRWNNVQEVKNTLQSMATEFKYLKEFDATSCLEQLYAIHEELKQLQEGLNPQHHQQQTGQYGKTTTTIRFDPHSNKIEMLVQEGADDDEWYADEMAAYYEDEEYFDYDESTEEEQNAVMSTYRCK